MNNGRREANQRRIMEDGGRKEGENDRRNQSEKNEKGCLQCARAASEEAGEVGITGAELRSPPYGRTGTANDVRAMLVG